MSTSRREPKSKRKLGVGSALAAVVVSLALGGLTTPSAHADAPVGMVDGGIEGAYVTPDGLMAVIDPAAQGNALGTPHGTFDSVDAGTRPAITSVYSSTPGLYEAAWTEGSFKHLWTIDNSLEPHDTGQPVMPGTSPAILGEQAGPVMLVWVGQDGFLKFMDNGQVTSIPTKVVPGTGPSITQTPTGNWSIAFYGEDSTGLDHLDYIVETNPTTVVQSNYVVQAKTTPSIAVDPNAVAFNQSGNNDLVWADLRESQFTVDSGVAMDPASSPALYRRVDPQAQGKILEDIAAIQTPDHRMEVVLDKGQAVGGNRKTALALDPGASPAVTDISVGSANFPQVMMVEGSTHNLYTFDAGAGITHPTSVPAKPGTSPAITTLFKPASPTTPPPGTSQATLSLDKQSVTSGPIPYAGKFPPFGSVQPGTVQSMTLPQSGFLDSSLKFVKAGHTSAECNTASAVVVLGEGQTTTPDQMTAIFGTATPAFSTTSPFAAVACYSGSTTPNFVNVQMTVKFN